MKKLNLCMSNADNILRSMSYAKIATLPPEYGLYSSFVGVFIYCVSASSYF